MLEEAKMLSVNQMVAQMKLTEMLKVTHIQEYPIRVERKSKKTEDKETRSVLRNDIKITGISSISNKSFIVSAAKLWNTAPVIIRDSETNYFGKKEIFKLCTLFLYSSIFQMPT